MVDEKRLLDVVTNVVLDCQDLPSDDQLFALQLAWWATASNIRNAQVDTPRWFPAARERQAAMLERMADWVRGDDIDPELERLWQQADHEGLVKHLRRGHA
jgi:hypothetical protein